MDLLSNLARRRALVDSHGASFESAPAKSSTDAAFFSTGKSSLTSDVAIVATAKGLSNPSPESPRPRRMSRDSAVSPESDATHKLQEGVVESEGTSASQRRQSWGNAACTPTKRLSEVSMPDSSPRARRLSNVSAQSPCEGLKEKLQRRRAVVEDEGTSFESKPTEHVACHMAWEKAATNESPCALVPRSLTCTDFEEVINLRRSLTDEKGTTFESSPGLFSESKLPPSPVRSRRVSLGPPSMPALPPDAVKARRVHQLLGELAGEVASQVPKALPDVTLASPDGILSFQDDCVLWVVIPEVDESMNKTSPAFTLPGCNETSRFQIRQGRHGGLSRNCVTLALRGSQPRKSIVLAALFVGEKGMTPQEWKGPVMDELYTYECTVGQPIVCGCFYKVIDR